MDSWLNDLRYALRTLRRKPLWTTLALVTLALGIGANTAIFSVVRGVLLSPLPYPGAERIVRVWPETVVSTEFFFHLRARTTALEALALYQPTAFAMVGDGRPEEIRGVLVTPEYFDVLGARPALGRDFSPEESEPGQGAAAILSHALWQQRFAGDPEILGRTLVLDGREHAIVGVMPAGHTSLGDGWQLWVPFEIDPGVDRHWDWITYPLLGRLRLDVNPEQTAAELRAAIASYDQLRPGYLSHHLEEGGAGASVSRLRDHLVGEVETTFWLLFAAVGCVLLIACANVANLLLARINARRRELALRNALGAGRGRLLVQILTESTLLALAGGVLGLIVASWTLGFLVRQLPASVPRTQNVGIDAGVLFFTLGVALAAGLIVGLLPALAAARGDLRAAIGTGDRGIDRGAHRLDHALITAEIAVAVVLAIGAGLLVKSFHRLQQVDVGFRSERVLTLGLMPPTSSYPEDADRGAYMERVAERVREIPGVASAAVISRLPMTPGDVGIAFQLEGTDMPADFRSVSVRMISPELLETLEIPLLAGRPLGRDDRADTEPVGLINRAMARRLWGDADPVGERIVFDTGELWFTVVGVIGDIRQHRLDQETRPQVYRPLAQSSWTRRLALVIRAEAGVETLLPAIEQAIWSIDPGVPITDVATMEERIRRSMTDARLITTLFALFALLALTLGAIGVFGVTAYVVGQRTREHGIRIALGATAGEVVSGSLRRALVPVLLGLVAGAAAAFALGRYLASFLYHVEPTDPAVYAAVGLLLFLAAALAGYLPARRATRIDPAAVLRAD